MEKRFAFDLEVLVVSRRLGFKRVLEAPVVLRHQFTSTISLRAVAQTLLDTCAIYYRAEILRSYDAPTPTPKPTPTAGPGSNSDRAGAPGAAPPGREPALTAGRSRERERDAPLG
jgi:hypothetical protein